MTEQHPPEDATPAQPDPFFVPVSPVPTNVRWQSAQVDGLGPMVILSFATPVGTSSYFFPAGSALSLADGIAAAAREAEMNRRGIIVPDVDTQAVLKAVKNGDKGRRR